MMTASYGCADYRLEMVLIGLRRRLQSESLSQEERLELRNRIRELEKQIGLEEG